MTLSLGLPNRNREVSFGEKGVSLTSEVLCQGWGEGALNGNKQNGDH